MTNFTETLDLNYDHSVFMALDWSCTSPRLNAAIDYLLPRLNLPGRLDDNRLHLQYLLIALIRLSRYMEGGYLAYSRNNNFDASHWLPNPFQLKFRRFRVIIDALVQHNYLTDIRGIYFPPYTRASRCKPTNTFLQLMNRFELHTLAPTQVLPYRGVFLRNTEKLLVPYETNDSIIKMQDDLEAYNNFIAAQEIELAQSINFSGFFDRIATYRVFNNESFELGGRYYGGWWSQLSSQLRRNIIINREDTVELDYRANHLYLVYGLQNTEMSQGFRNDPYQIDSACPREVTKEFILTMLNSNQSMTAYRALLKKPNFRTWNSQPDRRMILDHEDYQAMVFTICEAHPVLWEYIWNNSGLSLMYYDALVATEVINSLTEQGITCLCIHDSFVVQLRHEQALREAMIAAYHLINLPLALPPIVRKV